MTTSPAQPSFLTATGFSLLEFPDEPQGRFSRPDFDRLLVWCSNNNVSDINLTTGDRISVKTSGRIMRVTKRVFSNNEVSDLMGYMYGSDAISGDLSGGQDRDFAYDLKPDRNTRYRFRVNASATMVQGQVGYQVTLRTIASKPIELRLLNLEPEIFRNMAPHDGMVVITGATGSGKSTLLAAMLRYMVEQADANLKVLTYESPIENVYDELDMPSSIVCQSEVPRNLPTFSAGTRNSLRRAPEVILVGEARDAETIGESITASMTGHALYTTVHSKDVPSTIPRMINVFPEGERNSRAADLITSMHMIVSQRLEKTPDGGRVALREFLVLTPEIKEELLSSNLDQLSLVTKRILDEHGQTFLKDARRKFAEGKLSAEQLRAEEKKDAASRRDAERQARMGQPRVIGQAGLEPLDPSPVSGAAPIPAPSAGRSPAGVVAIEEPQGGDDRLGSLGGNF